MPRATPGNQYEGDMNHLRPPDSAFDEIREWKVAIKMERGEIEREWDRIRKAQAEIARTRPGFDSRPQARVSTRLHSHSPARYSARSGSRRASRSPRRNPASSSPTRQPTSSMPLDATAVHLGYTALILWARLSLQRGWDRWAAKLLSDPGPSEALKAKVFGALEDRRQQVLQLETKNEMLLAIIEAEKQNSSGQQASATEECLLVAEARIRELETEVAMLKGGVNPLATAGAGAGEGARSDAASAAISPEKKAAALAAMSATEEASITVNMMAAMSPEEKVAELAAMPQEEKSAALAAMSPDERATALAPALALIALPVFKNIGNVFRMMEGLYRRHQTEFETGEFKRTIAEWKKKSSTFVFTSDEDE